MNPAHSSTSKYCYDQAKCPSTARQLALPFMIVVALFLSTFAAAAELPASPPTAWAIGLPNGYVIMERQARTVDVTAEDVARGTLEVREGTRLIIVTTGPSEVALDFRSSGGSFHAVGIDVSGQRAAISAGRATVVENNWAAGRHVVAISYRFTLAPATVPGVHDWPLEMSVHSPVPAVLPQDRLDHGLAVAGAGKRVEGDTSTGAR